MGDEHNGGAVRVDFAKLLHHLVGALTVECACRLVGKNHLGVVDHTAADARSLQLTARHLVDVVVGNFDDSQPAHQFLAALELFFCGKHIVF